MDHAIIKDEKEEFDEEMFDYLPPLDAFVKSEPQEVCSGVLEPIQPQSVSPVKRTRVQAGLDSGTTEMEDDEEFWPFSGKPLFHLILAKTHVTPPYTLSMPVKMIKELPNKAVPVVLRYCGKNWNMVYLGTNKAKRFDCAGWKAFVLDNNLKAGCGCFFELSECSQARIKFRVQVIRTDGIPGLDDAKDIGDTPDKPIMID